jgi:hypothetical protein
MNCKLCQEILDAYPMDGLSGDIRIRIEDHLKNCGNCAEVHRLLALAERIFQEEKQLTANPFLLTRIMSAIEDKDITAPRAVPVLTRIMKPAAILAALAAAVFVGNLLGNLPGSGTDKDAVPIELSLIDDANIESVTRLSHE